MWATRVFRPNLQIKNPPAGQELLHASSEEQRAFVIDTMAWLQDLGNHAWMSWAMIASLTALLRRTLPFT